MFYLCFHSFLSLRRSVDTSWSNGKQKKGYRKGKRTDVSIFASAISVVIFTLALSTKDKSLQFSHLYIVPTAMHVGF